MGAAGVSNSSALIFGGSVPPNTGATEDWNGSSWSELADMSVARQQNRGSGNVTAALSAGGNQTPVSAATEEWSGSTTVTKSIDTD